MTPRSSLLKILCGAALAPFGWGTVPADETLDRLRRDFANPPDSARARTWWHWMNGNISREGITADLEAMKRVGLGGVALFNVSMETPRGPVDFLTPEWIDLLEHAVSEAERLGLEFGLHNCDGFSEAGGPWITPELSMKKLVWTETRVRGGAEGITLPHPETLLDFYREVAVIAFPAPRGETVQPGAARAKVSSSVPGFDGAAVVDGSMETTGRVPRTGPERREFIQFEFPTVRTVRTMVLETPMPGGRVGAPPLEAARLLTSADGREFQPVAVFNPNWSRVDTPVFSTTVAFDAVRARFFRLEFMNCPELEIAEARFFEAPRIHYWELKAGQARVREHGGEWGAINAPGGPVVEVSHPPALVPETGSILDLSDRLAADGTLSWHAPAGEWIVLRLGYTTTGVRNRPATPLGEGLECDKLDARGIEAHFPEFIGRLAEKLGPRTGKAFRLAQTDSWECGLQTWTDILPAEFKRRRSYDLLPFLPVLTTGRVIGSHARSERFLWDYRRTVADMIRENYYERYRELAHAQGLVYVNEGAGRQQYMYDPINYQAPADISMGEFWVPTDLRADNRVASSVAHTYGRKLAAGEAFTGNERHAGWRMDPFALKALGDEAFCAGINYFLLHRFAHQPWMGVAPGMTMGKTGTEFERTNTWWELARDWMSYLARCQFLLRQGGFVADVCHFIGEDVPGFLGHRDDLWMPLPAGYDFDGCNEELLQRFSVRDGRLVLPHGLSYRVLLLPNQRTMRPAALRKIRDLVRDGAVVIGPRPEHSPSLEGYPACDDEVQRLAAEVWGDCDGRTVREHRFGQGRVIWGRPWDEIFRSVGAPPDFSFSAGAGVEVNYIHRRTTGADVYFVASGSPDTVEVDARFRVEGKAPEFWHPDTGRVERPALYEQVAGGIRVPLRFDPSGSVFVVFRDEGDSRHLVDVTPEGIRASAKPSRGSEAPDLPDMVLRRERDGQLVAEIAQAGRYRLKAKDGSIRTIGVTRLPQAIEVGGGWEVTFPFRKAAPRAIRFERLESWTDSTDDAVKHFSGTATYLRQIDIPAEMLGDGRVLYLDLGRVRNLAEVKLNGVDLGVWWKPPMRVDISAAAKPGTNRLEVRVTNLWVNRLIGDSRYPDEVEWRPTGAPGDWPGWLREGRPPPESRKRQTFAAWKYWSSDDPLLESGLLGPVRLIPAALVEADN